jgi:2-methylisocitrate lyase-like PEP mutase family enzyme
MLDNGKAVVVPGVDDPLGAKMARELGFEAIYVGSYSASATMLGQPDAGFVTQTEMAQRIRYITDAVPDMIVFGDGEHGFGGPLNLKRTINSYEHAGASALQFNDTAQIESRCPFIGLPDTTPLPLEEMLAKIRFANQVRTDPDFLIYTPAKGDTTAERVERARAYLKAGAGSVFATWKTKDDLREFADGLKDLGRPLKSSCYPFAPQHPSVRELTEMGYQIIFFVLHPLYVAAQAVWDLLKELKETGNVTTSLQRAIPHERLLAVLGIEDVKRDGFQHLAMEAEVARTSQ